MRIVIDLQSAQGGSRFRGIGRYSTALTKSLIRLGSDRHEFYLAVSDAFPGTIDAIKQEFQGLLPPDRIVTFCVASPVSHAVESNDARRVASELLRESLLASLDPDVVLVTSLIEGGGENVVTSIGRSSLSVPTVAILYDLIPYIFPDEYLGNPMARRWYDEKLAFLEASDLLLAISESSRQEGIKYLGISPEKIVNVSTAIEPAFYGMVGAARQDVEQKFSIKKPYLMYSGASDPRKNLPRLIEAYAGLGTSLCDQYQLVLAGGMPQVHRDQLRQIAEENGLDQSQVILTGHITDSEMIGLYKNAYGFVFSSYHEGFGLPALEAMAFDIPVIGSNRSSVPEVIGLAEALFDPFSVPSMRDAMHRLLTDAGYRDRLVRHGKVQRLKFSWDHSAEEALRAVEQAFPDGSRKPAAFPRLALETQLAVVSSEIGSAIAELERSPGDVDSIASAIDVTFPRAGGERCLFVDVSELRRDDHGTGIQRVVRNILKAMLLQPPAGYRVVPVYTSMEDTYQVADGFIARFLGFPSAVPDGGFLDARAGDIFLGLDFHDVLVPFRRMELQKLRDKGVNTYFVVYDLLPHTLPEFFPEQVSENFETWLHTVAQADGLICISKAVADEMLGWVKRELPDREGSLKLGWFHLGSDFLDARPSQARSDPSLAVIRSSPSFLLVSTIEPRKRQAQVLDGFEIVWARGEQACLVLAGKAGWMVSDLVDRIRSHPELGKRLFWFESPSDSLLSELYQNCSCLIAASMGEGFGLSLVEAARAGTSILARDIPVYREIAGEHASYFSGNYGSDVADAVGRWLRDSAGGRRVESAGMTRLTWTQSYEMFRKVLFEDGWYETWAPPKAYRFRGDDPRLGSQVGIRKGSKILSSGRAGYLVFGPNAGLKSGTYSVRLLGSAKGAGLGSANHAELVIDKGNRQLDRKPLAAESNGRELASFLLNLQADCNDLEIRVWIDDAAEVEIEGIIIAHSQ